eukprot:scaffold260_cov115-Cylindrotheca_fusiformis.AAC.3
MIRDGMDDISEIEGGDKITQSEDTGGKEPPNEEITNTLLYLFFVQMIPGLLSCILRTIV